MISETSLMDCENVPVEMQQQFDRPWNFVGEVTRTPSPRNVECLCRKCNALPLRYDDHRPASKHMLRSVTLRGRLFITDDMIEVVLYFGVCEACGAVYWARQGPPFTRARCLSGAMV